MSKISWCFSSQDFLSLHTLFCRNEFLQSIWPHVKLFLSLVKTHSPYCPHTLTHTHTHTRTYRQSSCSLTPQPLGPWGRRWGVGKHHSLLQAFIEYFLYKIYQLLAVEGLEKAMAPRSSTLSWKIPWTEKPGRLQSMGSRRVGHN